MSVQIRPWPPRVWSQEECDQLIDLVRKGVGPYTIGREMGIAAATVSRKTRALAQEIGARAPLQTTWTPERMGLLRDLLAAGNSCSQAAAALGNGITRNAVIGKKFRMNLPTVHQQFRPSEKSAEAAPPREPRKRTRYPGRAKAMQNRSTMPEHRAGPAPTIWPQEIPLAPDTPPENGIPFEDLRIGRCKYPYGENAPFVFCGAPAAKSWCPAHERKVFRPKPVR